MSRQLLGHSFWQRVSSPYTSGFQRLFADCCPMRIWLFHRSKMVITSPYSRDTLREAFGINPWPSPSQYHELAVLSLLPKKTVNDWFNTKRDTYAVELVCSVVERAFLNPFSHCPPFLSLFCLCLVCVRACCALSAGGLQNITSCSNTS